jgi:hypothetical protein
MIYPFNSDNFLQVWEYWKAYKKEQFKFTYKPIGEQVALKSLSEDSGHNEDLAIQMIYHSMACGYRGVFPIRTRIQSNKPKTLFEQMTESYGK